MNLMKKRRHIDEMKPGEINGFFTDDGFEVPREEIPLPPLCLTCIHCDDPNEEIECMLNRMDQRKSKKFECGVYRKLPTA
jgi:hypothetical protein